MFYGYFHETEPEAIEPAGFIKERLEIQNKGLSSHYKEQGYPFDTPMWDGGVGHVILPSPVCHDDATVPFLAEAWWPYEQSAYLLDGIVRLGVVLQDQEKLELFRKNLMYAITHAKENGLLGRCYNESPSEWPMVVFFRAAWIYYRYTKDKSVLDALHRHYSALTSKQLSNGFRHINALEGILHTYAETGDETLLEKALQAYKEHDELNTIRTDNEFELHWSRLTSGRNFVIHGVSFSESLKIPVLLYLFSGKEEYLQGAEKALKKILSDHEQIVGMISSNEDFSGQDPMQGYETCVISDFTWALGYFLQATGKAEYADRIEKIIYNALPGACLPDFTGLVYYSGANQAVASEKSNHSFYFRGQDDSRRFAPSHSAQCCSGNVHRAMPNYALRLWMLDKDNGPVAAMYGSSVFKGTFDGKNYSIEEETEYPSSGIIRFRFHGSDITMPFTFRIPGWCSHAEVKINGEIHPEYAIGGKYHTAKREWKDGDTVEINLAIIPVLKKNRYWCWAEAGTLVFTLPIEHTDRLIGKGPICPHEMWPTGKWNYGISQDAHLKLEHDKNGLYIQINAFPISNYDDLEDGRFTPEMPLFFKVTGPEETLKLRPYGTAPLRMTAFPILAERTVLPVYQVKVSKTYPYDFRKPLSEQKYLPESLSDKENLDMAEVMQGDRVMYYDLMHHFGPLNDVLAYVYFRFWAEDACDNAVFAISASNGAECFLNGKKIYTIEPPADGEFMAPFLFTAPVHKGYNLLTMKVCKGFIPLQYRKAWGAKVQCWIERIK